MKKSFGSRGLCKLLKCLCFQPHKQDSSSHVKYDVPSDREIQTGVYPFITVILNRKSYDPNTRSSYIRQIKNLGFTKKEIEVCL